VGCNGVHDATTTTPMSPAPPTPTSSHRFAAASCATPGVTAVSGCWGEILPLGSGGFPAAPGSQDRPLWEPGKFPLTLLPVLAFDGQLWMTARTLAYSSPDGPTWTEHDKTDWGERIYHSIVYFKGKLWMYGGLDYEGRTFLNDVWVSSDGVTWAQVGIAAWSARGSHTMVVYHDDLFLVGGGGWADVWRSPNGADWTPLTPEAEWKPRHGNARVVFDSKLWVFGGWVGASTNCLNDVWYSDDGTTWNRQAEHAPWAERAPLAINYQDEIWMYSGKHTGGDDNWGGDLWQMTATPSQ
jgi:Galactose oxidase, central domain/Kelch motif